MRRRTFGTTDLHASELGVDVGALAARAADRDRSPEGPAALLRRALDLGITFFDADPVAGEGGDGLAERLLGQAIRGVRDELTIASRFGYEVITEWDRPGVRELRHNWSPASLGAALDRSLSNLRTEPVDLWQLHHPTMAELEADDLFGFLDEQVVKGKVRRYGVLLGPGVGWADEGVAAMRERGVAAVQTVYNVFDQDPGRELLRVAGEVGAGVVVDAPEGRGTGRPRRRLERLDFLARDRDQTMAQALLRFVLDAPAVTTVLLPPVDDPDRLAEFALATELPSLTDEDLARIAELHEAGFGDAADGPAADAPAAEGRDGSTRTG
jgi:aryl-alcohol dehydrogenase-like predicted oxidoreductase